VVKRYVASLLKHLAPLRWLFGLAIRVAAPRHRIGVLALVLGDDGQVLVATHTFRPWNPSGLPGGWIEPGEEPHIALHRELMEEFGGGLRVTVQDLLIAGQHASGGEPGGLSLIYQARLEGDLPSELPLELLSLGWSSADDARELLRPLEVRALEAAIKAASRP
jgi:8-oxo-dGTP pyrophosphatase MutT (NUDIX family)